MTSLFASSTLLGLCLTLIRILLPLFLLIAAPALMKFLFFIAVLAGSDMNSTAAAVAVALDALLLGRRRSPSPSQKRRRKRKGAIIFFLFSSFFPVREHFARLIGRFMLFYLLPRLLATIFGVLLLAAFSSSTFETMCCSSNLPMDECNCTIANSQFS